MSVIVNKSALVTLIKKLTSENRSFHSLDISEIPGKDTEIPIEPKEQMAVQLSVDKPPVDDPDYSPTSGPDLAVAASAITDEVPDDQVKYFYQGLHRLLDLALQRQGNKTRISESTLRTFLESISENTSEDNLENPEDETAENEDLPAEQDREYYISTKIDSIVDMIIKAKLHLIEVPGTNITDFETGQNRPEMTIVSAGAVSYVLDRAMEKREIKKSIEQAIDELKINRSVFMTMLMNDLTGYLGKEEKVDDDLAAEMFSNILTDKEMKAAEGNVEQFKAGIERYTKLDKQFKNKNPEDKFSFSLSELGAYSVTVGRMLELIEDAKQDAISQLEGESQSEEEEAAPTEEGLSKAEVEEIRKMIRQETLASEYEPGKLNLSQEAIRAFIEKISEETGQSIGDVRNIFYEDLKASGMDNEVLRKVFGLRRMPRGRQNIPLIYDPLKVRAEEEVVTKLYDVFMHNLGVFLEDRIDAQDPIAQDLKDKLLGPSGLYQPGIEGYQRLQSVVGLPDEGADIDSSTFRDTRSAYEAVQEFIDIMAKDHIVPEDIKAKGGLKMIIKDFEENHDVFGTLDEREDFDEFIKGQIRMYDSFKKDTPRSQNRIFDVIGKALSKAPKRRDRYINKLKSERGS
tara:strand:- start:101 stop:1990 length:1890 start_codon:yes stop_codon:yes gene_type:complete